MKVWFNFILGLLCLANLCFGWLPLKSEVPMGHGQVEFRVRKFHKPSGKFDVGSYRLPTTISPIHYDLDIRPIIEQDRTDPGEQFTAPGVVTIKIKCVKLTNSIVLHAKYLDINFRQIRVTQLETAIPVRVTGFNYDEDDDRNFYTIFLDRDMTIDGEYLLRIPFVAIVAYPEARQSGIYRSTYPGSDGELKMLVVTQFQKAYAREAFPCFDEPSFLFKATFSIRIGRKETYMSWSNTERLGEPEPIDNLPGWVWDTYTTTLKLPIYTIAFAVANDYAAETSPKDKYRLPINTWLPKNRLSKSSGKFAASVSADVLKFYEELFDFPYPANKMENFGAPLELWGMEHIGLVTYRPQFLLWSDDHNTQFDKWNSAWLIAHEYVHMWFGNLVTCEWWNDFWLNEGFARYFQYVGAQISAPGYRANDRFVLDVNQWAMILDEGPDSVPVHGNETDRVTYAPFQIEYDKAGALIRMMATFLTQDTFFSALKNYFKRHQFNNTVQDDLFEAMTEQAVKDGTLTHHTVKEIMDPWTKMKGFPVVRVSRADNDTIYVSQHRFVYHPSATNVEPGLWYVPIWYVTKKQPSFNSNTTIPQFWMERDIITYFHVETTDEWIIVNPEARGYYRVVYDDHLTNLIMKQMAEDHLVFHFSTRSQLIDDYFRSAQARYISIHFAMEMTWYLGKEDDLMVWTTVLNNLRTMYTRLVDTSIITPFRMHMLKLIIPPLQRLGVEQKSKDTPSTIMLRAQLLDWACALEHKLCKDYAKKMFAKWMENPDANPIAPDYQPQLYCAAVAYSTDREEHNFLLKHYKKTNNNRQRNLVIKALACDQTEEFLKTLLDKSINVKDKEIDVKTHGRLLLESLSGSSTGRNMTWNFIRDRHRRIKKIHGPWIVPWLISTLAPYASSKGLNKLHIEMTSFISQYTRRYELNDEVENSLQTSAHKIVENSFWMEYHFNDLKDWLLTHVKS